MIRVLIVDDDKLARRGLIAMFPWKQYDMEIVGEAQNGRAALEFLEKQPVDLAFVDIDMPEMNGLELIERCREVHPEIHFVILTFYEDFVYAQNAIRLGVLDYISKLRIDSEDSGAILERIRDKMRNAAGAETAAAAEENRVDADSERGVDSEKWKELTDRWENGYWLYDDREFEELCEACGKLDHVFTSMQHFAEWLVRSTEASLGMENAAGELRIQLDARDGIDGIWKILGEWRGRMYRFAVEEGSLGKMPVCILRTICYIREHVEESLHTEEVAERVGMSRSYFSVNFKKLTGCTFHEYVRTERMRRAKELLAETELGITEVAARSGYEDVNYFNKVFQEETHCSPGHYRKEHLP